MGTDERATLPTLREALQQLADDFDARERGDILPVALGARVSMLVLKLYDEITRLQRAAPPAPPAPSEAEVTEALVRAARRAYAVEYAAARSRSPRGHLHQHDAALRAALRAALAAVLAGRAGGGA